MQEHLHRNFGPYLPEHESPGRDPAIELRRKIDTANLTGMWNMILLLDYQVSDLSALRADKREEFLDVMSLLLAAFDR